MEARELARSVAGSIARMNFIESWENSSYYIYTRECKSLVRSRFFNAVIAVSVIDSINRAPWFSSDYIFHWLYKNS